MPLTKQRRTRKAPDPRAGTETQPSRPAPPTRASPGVDGLHADPALALKPVFIVSGFRTSSTWLWARVRDAPTTTAYYEIFHPGLATFTPKTVHQTTPAQWRSGHPASAGYFLEFLPLLRKKGGVVDFHESMATDSFLPADGFDGDLTPNEKTYVASLIAHAHAEGRVPVLTCTRILGRSRALRKAFPSHNVMLHRNIFHQWASCSAQAIAGNAYFMNQIEVIIAAAKHDPFVHSLDDWFQNRTASPYNEADFAVFCILHLYLYAKAFDAADLVIDTTAIATDPGLRMMVERRLTSMVGSNVDLSDATSNLESSLVEVRSKAALVDTIDQFTKQIVTLCDTPDAIALVSTLKDDFLAEWSRHEFYVRATRTVLSRQRDEAIGSANEQHAKTALLEQDRVSLAAQLATANEKRASMAQRLWDATASLAGFGTALADAIAQRDDANRARAAMFADASAARERAQQEASVLRERCDRLTKELARPALARAVARVKSRLLSLVFGRRDSRNVN